MKRFSRKAGISRLLKRREVLGFLGVTTSVWLAGCLRNESNAVETNPSSIQPSPAVSTQRLIPTNSSCVVRPQQTAGPFYIEENLNRSDIRSDPSTGSVRSGVPLQLAFQVSQITAGTCTPLKDAIVDVWHCDAEGIYSDVGDAVGQKFLRGSQITNGEGVAQFTTIYPGWYPGRAVHIHFKIRSHSDSETGYEFTSQLYFDDELTDQIFRQTPYAVRGDRTVRNNQDGIFQRGGDQLMVPITQEGDRYVGKFAIALEL